MQQFKISEAGYKIFRKRWITIILPASIAGVLIFYIFNILLAHGGDITTWLIAIPLVGIYIAFNIHRTLKRQKKVLLSYSVTISEDGITREQINLPPLSISFMEIKEIIKTKKGGFIIKGLHRTDVIHIPYLIDDPATLEEHLQALAPVGFNRKDALYRKLMSLLVFLAVGLLICLYDVTNKIIVGISGVLLTGLLSWLFYEIYTNKNAPTNLKRSMWFIIVIIAFVIYLTYARLTNIPV